MIISVYVTLFLLQLCSCFGKGNHVLQVPLSSVYSDTNDVFFISSTFKGNHSESRMNKQLVWFQNVTLQSISNSADFFAERMPTKPHIYYFLRLSGSYKMRSLPKRWWATRFPNVQIVYLTGKNDRDLIIALGTQYGGSIMSITRLDADDSIALNFFYQLTDLKKVVDFSKDVLLSGSDTLAMLDIGKTRDGKGFYCQYSLHRRPYIMSIGLTVTLQVSVWNQTMAGRIDFDNHTKVRGLITKLLADKGVSLNVREVHLSQVTGLYLKTDLSSRHESPPSNVTDVPCDRHIMDHRIGPDNSDLLWTAVYASLPTLTPQELLQNVHTLHHIRVRNTTAHAHAAEQKQVRHHTRSDAVHNS